MATIKEYLDYAELAQASYGSFSIGTPSINELTKSKYNGGEVHFSTQQAIDFAIRYVVVVQ